MLSHRQMFASRGAAALFCLLLAALAPAPAAAAFYLKDGDVVVFYGDSITEQRGYSSYVETFVVTRFPWARVRFVNSGWTSDRVVGGHGGPIDTRLWRDVITYAPTVVPIMLGMNDGGFREFEPKFFDKYQEGYRHIVETLKTAIPGVRLTLIKPSAYDDICQEPSFEGGYNKVLDKYGDFLATLAQEEHLQLVDAHSPMLKALKAIHKEDEECAGIVLMQDRIHPTLAGHILIAEALLKGWGAPSTVSEVEIDAAAGRLTGSQKATVTQLKIKDGTLSWHQLDKSLPMAFDTRDENIRKVLDHSDFFDSLNREILRVRGLAKKEYNLIIDGTAVKIFTGKKLAEGVNLALLDTPMVRQAKDVHWMTQRHNDLHMLEWRSLEMPYLNDKLPHLRQALQSVDALEKDLVERQHKIAQPVEHAFQLVPVEEGIASKADSH